MKKIQVSLLVLVGVLYVSGLAIAGPLTVGLDASNNAQASGDAADVNTLATNWSIAGLQANNTATGSTVAVTVPLGDVTLAGTATVTVPDATRKVNITGMAAGSSASLSLTFVHDTSGIGVNTPGLAVQMVSNDHKGAVTATGQIGNFELVSLGAKAPNFNYSMIVHGSETNIAVSPDVL